MPGVFGNINKANFNRYGFGKASSSRNKKGFWKNVRVQNFCLAKLT